MAPESGFSSARRRASTRRAYACRPAELSLGTPHSPNSGPRAATLAPTRLFSADLRPGGTPRSPWNRNCRRLRVAGEVYLFTFMIEMGPQCVRANLISWRQEVKRKRFALPLAPLQRFSLSAFQLLLPSTLTPQRSTPPQPSTINAQLLSRVCPSRARCGNHLLLQRAATATRWDREAGRRVSKARGQ
jgi:hypothetical protein